MGNYKVYVHISLICKKFIGITSTELNKRWKNGKGYKDSPLFYNAILKYGWDNFKHKVLYENLTEKQAKQKEKDLISFYKTNDRRYGYNLTEGGEGCVGYRHSKETKEKMRLNHADFSGEKNPFYNKMMSKELKNKLLMTHLGIPLPKETKDKISKSLKGRKMSDEWIEKRRGKNNFSYGKTGSQSPVAKEILQYTKDGTFVKRWETITMASKEHNVTVQSICKALKKGSLCKGFLWKYSK